MTNNNRFTIDARPSAISQDERAARPAAAYDPLLAVYTRLIQLAEAAERQRREGTAVQASEEGQPHDEKK